MSRQTIAAVIAFLLSSCGVVQEDAADPSEAGSLDTAIPAMEHEIAPDDMRAIKIRAEAGELAASLALADHYAFAELNHEEARHWYRRAANGGSIPAMQALAIYLANEGSAGSCSKAVEWIERAISAAKDEKVISQFGLRETLARLKDRKCQK